MKTAILSLGLAANLVAAAGLRPRDPESDLAAFNSAADALISQYIPQPEWEALTSAVGSAASAAGVTADVKDVIYSALKATEAPSWFASVVPTAYSSQYQALETAIDSLRPTVTVTVPRPTVIAITTTDENGSTIVATTTVTPSQTTITTDVVPTPSVSVVTGTDSAGNSYTSTVIDSNGTATGSAATTATETVTETTATGSASASETESASGTGTETAASGTTSGTASGTDAPSNGAPTAMANGLAGVVAVVGLVMAL